MRGARFRAAAGLSGPGGAYVPEMVGVARAGWPFEASERSACRLVCLRWSVLLGPAAIRGK